MKILIIFCNIVGAALLEISERNEQFCKTPYFGNLSWGARITEIYMQLEDLSLIECVRKCLRQKQCRSFNYSRQLLSCELSAVDSQTGTFHSNHRNMFIHSDISLWNKLLHVLNGMEESACVAGSKEIKSSSGVIQCIEPPSCGDPPSIPNSKVQYSGTKGGDKAVYTCDRGLDVSVCPIGDEVTHCQADGKWKSTDFTCQVVETCSDIRNCNRSYTDGEYFVYPNITDRQRVKVYCYDMSTTEPKEYITLYNDNRGVHNFSRLVSKEPCKWLDRAGDAVSVFRKIRIITETMTVIEGDLKFATVKFEEPKRAIPTYGKGEDCAAVSNSCPRLGYFRIDTTGTGLVVDPTLRWVTKGYRPRISSFKRTLATIEGICGGYCGHCFPEKPMQLFVDTRIETYDTKTTIVPTF